MRRWAGWASRPTSSSTAGTAYADRGETFDVEPEFNRLAQMLSGRYLLGEPFAEIADEFCDGRRGRQGTLAAGAAQHRARVHAASRRRSSRVSMPRSRRSMTASCGFIAAAPRHGLRRLRRADAHRRGQPRRRTEFDDKSLRDQISTLFFAGHETSATGAVLDPLGADAPSRDPRAAAARSDEGAGHTLADAPKICTSCSTRPGHRRVAAAALADPFDLARRAGRQHRRWVSRFPPAPRCVISMYAVHRLENLWPDPETFDPARFEPEKVAARSRFAYLPFAAGHRNCIGAGAGDGRAAS